MNEHDNTHDSGKLPPSAKLVKRVLDEHDRMTKREIAAEADLAESTTKYALRRLRNVDLVTYEPDPSDPRQRIYALDDPDSDA